MKEITTIPAVCPHCGNTVMLDPALPAEACPRCGGKIAAPAANRVQGTGDRESVVGNR